MTTGWHISPQAEKILINENVLFNQFVYKKVSYFNPELCLNIFIYLLKWIAIVIDLHSGLEIRCHLSKTMLTQFDPAVFGFVTKTQRGEIIFI